MAPPLSPWDIDLKLSLVRAIVYYRLIQLGANPYEPDAMDQFTFADPRLADEPGGDRLINALANFFLAKDADFHRPYHRRSSFRTTVAILFSELEQDRGIFPTSAREVALPIAERLLCCHGLRLAPETTRQAWEAEMQAVPLADSMHDRASQYEVLIRNYWSMDYLMPPSHHRVPAEQHLQPHEYFHDVTAWSTKIGFPRVSEVGLSTDYS